MSLDPLLLSRVQFAFVVSFHIIFPTFTIGLAAWLATIDGMRLATGNPQPCVTEPAPRLTISQRCAALLRKTRLIQAGLPLREFTASLS
jgi:hypothetical protein